MDDRYTVKQLAKMAGVTVRTLHHYDEIGLLKPTSVAANGYRYYGEASLYRLQQILFYRELDVPLEQIRRMVDGRRFDTLMALASHRTALRAEIRRLGRLLRTIDLTVSRMKGNMTVNDSQLFGGFSDDEQEKMAEEAAQRWDPATVRVSNERWKKYSPEERKRIIDEGNALYQDLMVLMSESPSSASVQAIVKRWHDHMQHFWSPDDVQLLGLADLYNEDPKFLANFEALKPGLATFMGEAIRAYVRIRE